MAEYPEGVKMGVVAFVSAMVGATVAWSLNRSTQDPKGAEK